MANTPGTQASIGNGQTLNADAAVYWRLLVAAVFAACGVWVIATEGTRTWQRQYYLWVNRFKPGFNPAWHPDDSRANHVAGRCVDVGSGVGFVLTLVSIAFYKLAGLYGFRATVSGEPWHFEWRLEWVSPAIRASVGTVPASTSATPISLPKEDDTMLVITNTGRKNNFLIGKHYAHILSDADVPLVAGVNSIEDEVHELSDAQTATVFAAYGIPDKYRTNPALLTTGGLEGYWSLEYSNGRDLAFIRAKLGA